MDGPHLADADYQRLLMFRTELRRFLRWSEETAQAQGLSPAQHQLLLAVRGWAGPDRPTIGDVADALLLRHHSAVELVDRSVLAGLVQRQADLHDARVVRLSLTRKANALIARLASRHLDELNRLASVIGQLAPDLAPAGGSDSTTAP